MVEAIKEMTVGELVSWITLLLAGISTVVEITPIKINPWTWLFQAIGRAINGEVIAMVNDLTEDVRRIDRDAGERNAKAARARVLRFGDELIHNVHHSKEHFDDILRDITEYEKYCDDHPEFENDRMQITAQYIKETYQKCMKEHSFL